MSNLENVQHDMLVESLTWRELDILGMLAKHHTNREIAQALGLELTTVKWYNKQIYSKLGVNSRYQAVAKAKEYGLLEETQPESDSLKKISKENLPTQLTSFVGRQPEIAKIKALLPDVHLLTLTGPGGTGKTRLALRVASEVVDEFEDGITFVDLAPIQQPHLVAETIAESLGILNRAGGSVIEILKKFLKTKNMLILLDNFEHLIEAAPLVGELLSSSPDLKIMITSREILRLYGEHEFIVPPLGLPEGKKSENISSLSEVEAIALFNHRARAVRSDYRFTKENASAVVEICTRLDGLPLAIELAAAHMRLFTPQALLKGLANRLTTLHSGPRDAPARQRTLRDTLAWSYDLLDEPEKRLFTRLAIFRGGCTLKAAEEICCQDLSIDVLKGIESLLSKSLLRMVEEHGNEPRVLMLETIYQYASERMQDFGEMKELEKRHARYFTSLAVQAEPYTRGGPLQIRWLWELEADHDNLRSAYAWATGDGDCELGLRLVSSLGFFWYRQGYFSEGKEWTSWALKAIRYASLATRADIFFTAGLVANFEMKVAESKHMYRKALMLYQQLKSTRNIGWTQTLLSYESVGEEREYESALALCGDGMSLLRENNDKAGVAHAFNVIGELARVQGDISRAKEAYEKCMEIACEIGDKLREGIQYLNLGLLSLREGDILPAQKLFQESLRLAKGIEQVVLTTDALVGLAEVAEVQNRLKLAAVIFGAVDRVYDSYGFNPQLGDTQGYERSKARVQAQLDLDSYEAARHLGWNMSLAEAVAYAFHETKSVL